ncbi:hypothetical protein CMV_006660 [Castanea mollissima]|uniref:Uncharacterized protein n=1 Tax=Castanea mollissima TaxID=60419 RepID=A0A8J4VT84_9ROSI|nr:hypothetical protein CMV_006660 [Castanea mollissima]
MGVARSNEEAAAFAQVLDEAGVILLICDKVEISLNQHLCREAKIGPKAHKLQSVLVSDLVVMGILGFGFKIHAHSILTGHKDVLILKKDLGEKVWVAELELGLELRSVHGEGLGCSLAEFILVLTMVLVANKS